MPSSIDASTSASSAEPVLSVVLPCYRAAPTARRSVAQLSEFLEGWLGGRWEIVVVDDGGGDFAASEWSDDPRVRLVRFVANRGKGAAVAAGMTTARGAYRLFTDVDIPYGMTPIPAMLHYLRSGHFHLVMGDRNLPGSSYHEAQGAVRRSVSRISALLIGTIVTGGFFDTQCGLKALRGDVADLVFPLMRITSFTFDVELLYIALLHRLDIKRIPVRLERNETSSVRIVRDSLKGLVDLALIGARRGRGRYELAALRDLTAREFASVTLAGGESGEVPAAPVR
jgi:dolichyl-phosphate beta-glucosyltransferase